MTGARRVLFALAPVILLSVGTELVLRAVGFEFSPFYLEEPIFRRDSDGTVRTARMFTDAKPYGFPLCVDQHFSAEKPEGAVRIVIVGGSSVFLLGKAPLLSSRLTDHFHRDIEIINAGFQGCGSDRVLLSAREAIGYKPDLLLVYTGHNEFLSFTNPATLCDGYGKPLQGSHPIGLRTVQFFSKLRCRIMPPPRKALEGIARWYEPAAKEPFYEAFRARLQQLIDEARGHGVLVVLGTMSFNYSVPPLYAQGYHRTQIDQLLSLSEQELRTELRQRPENAYVEFALGRLNCEQGNYEQGKRWLDLALCHDARPIRANIRINAIIQALGRQDGVVLADVNAAVAAQHPHGMADFRFFSDHCHLNDLGNQILQQTFADAVIQAHR